MQEISRKEIIRNKARESAKHIKNEFNKAVNTAILAAFGFLVALVWKDVITEFVDKLASLSPVQGKIISAGIITIICVFGIIIITRLFPYEE